MKDEVSFVFSTGYKIRIRIDSSTLNEMLANGNGCSTFLSVTE